MKSTKPSSLFARHAMLAASLSVLLGTASAVAQTTGSSGSSSGTSGSSTRGTGSTGTTDTSRSSGAYETGGSTATRSVPGASGQSGTGSTYGASDRSGRDATDGRLGWSERRFVTKASDHGKTELQLAQLATQQATHPDVKNFAQKLIQDHSMVNQELMTLAGSKQVKVDDDDDGKDRHYRRLANKSGHEFDQEFIEQMVEMHEDDVKLFEKTSQDARDPELKAFAAKHVDHLREHLQTAQTLRSTLATSGRMRDTGATGTSSTGSSSGFGTSGSATGTTDSTTGSRRLDSTGPTGSGRGTSSGSSTDTGTSGRPRTP